MSQSFQKRYRRKRDANSKEIINAFKKLGIQVFEVDEPCDLFCWDGLLYRPVEIKTKGGRFTEQQKQIPFLEVVRSVEDVTEKVHEWSNNLWRRWHQPVR